MRPNPAFLAHFATKNGKTSKNRDRKKRPYLANEEKSSEFTKIHQYNQTLIK